MLPTEHFVSQIQSSTGVILSPFYGLSIFSPQIYFLPTITKYHFFFYQIQEWKRHWPQGCTFQSSVLSLKFPICCPDSSLPQSIYVLFNSDKTVMISPTVMGITSITSFPYPCFEHYWAVSKTSSKHPFALNQLPWLLSDCHVRNQVSTIAFKTFETWSLCLQPQNTVFPSFSYIGTNSTHYPMLQLLLGYLKVKLVIYWKFACSTRCSWGIIHFTGTSPEYRRMATYSCTNPPIHLPSQQASHPRNVQYALWLLVLCCVQGISLPPKQWPLLPWILQTMETSFRKTHLQVNTKL